MRILTALERVAVWHQATPPRHLEPQIPHGTPNGFGVFGCHCDKCAAAWRDAVGGRTKHEAAPRDPDVWREPTFLLDRRTDPQAPSGHFLNPADAYDERGWEKRYRGHPPDPTPVNVDWFHATRASLPVGAVLEARAGKAPWLDSPYHGGLDNRAHWTWIEHDLTHSDEWLRYLVRDHGHGYLYEVKPLGGVFPWNGDAREGWVTPAARIIRKVKEAP